MLKVLAVIGILVLVAVAAILVIASRKPDEFRVSRSTVIQAPPEKIYAQIADMHAWTAWSPYEKKDPAMKRTFSGAERGKGAVYEWNGNKDIGTGRMEITETVEPSEGAPSKIVIKLDFYTPFEAHNTAEFTLVPRADGTAVTWAMFGPNVFMGKVMSLFMNMDKMVGDDFAVGLANLKAISER
ncbi:MAG TPA: SRPBCC family protein [Alphaproteobacteria bacterium]|jgi:uncharacterized protein YndB with AHSA1/START domain